MASSNKWEVLYEDNHLLAINKPSGILVQGDSTGDEPLVELCKKYIKEKYNKPGEVFLGVVHRLDRPVSGVVVFARTSKALERMNALFRHRETKKTYWAIVQTKPKTDTGTLVHWLVKDESKNKAIAFAKENKDGQRSELSYHLLRQRSGYFLLEVNPVTGRPHQIRVQLASMNCVIVGDLKYGFDQPNPDKSICLHARQLEFIHPVKKERISLTAPLPTNDIWNLFS
ncbi:MAG TPA: RluA family pseudouridine synthase [Cyclobacteriaceae bacterium]|jgi:23S rRNA pseudouridine1911/1915/1917 synthase|nr:RluA family pseudouridine synthase [Cyclobacteriaceae bacterium]